MTVDDCMEALLAEWGIDWQKVLKLEIQYMQAQPQQAGARLAGEARAVEEGRTVDEGGKRNQVNKRWKLFAMVRRESFGMHSVNELLYFLPQGCFHDTTVSRLINLPKLPPRRLSKRIQVVLQWTLDRYREYKPTRAG